MSILFLELNDICQFYMETLFAHILLKTFYITWSLEIDIKRSNILESVKSFMRDYPIFSRALIFPLALYITIGITSELIKLLVPLIIALIITNEFYSKAIGKTYKESVYEPYTYVKTRYYSSP